MSLPLLSHPLSTSTDIPNSWILEFVLRQPIPDHLAHSIFLSLPFSSSSSSSHFHPLLRKTILLRRLASDSLSSESSLLSLELLEQHDRLHGSPPSPRLKAAYCAAALSCTAAARRSGAAAFSDAVERIWKARVADARRSEAAAGLVSRKLVEWGERMEEEVRRGGEEHDLFDPEEGMRLVADYLNEAAEEIGPSFLQIAADRRSARVRVSEDDGFRLHPVVEADEEGCVNLSGHDMSDPGGGLIHKLVPGEVSKVKEALRNSRLELQMIVEDPLPEAEIASAAASISISSGNVFLNEPAKHSSRGNAVLPASIELVAEVPAGLDTSTGALVKEKCNLVPLPDFVNRDPSDSKHLKENGIVEECNKDAEPSKCKDILDRHNFFERNPTGYTCELSDDSLQSRFVKSTDLTPNPKTKRVSPCKLDDRKLVKRRAVKRWTLLEENTLREAVAKHGTGNWKLILSFNAKIFEGRTEVDLKDKWRNMSRYLLQV